MRGALLRQICQRPSEGAGLPEFQKALNVEIAKNAAPETGQNQNVLVVKTDVKSLLHRHEELDIIAVREYVDTLHASQTLVPAVLSAASNSAMAGLLGGGGASSDDNDWPWRRFS